MPATQVFAIGQLDIECVYGMALPWNTPSKTTSPAVDGSPLRPNSARETIANSGAHLCDSPGSLTGQTGCALERGVEGLAMHRCVPVALIPKA